MGANSGGDACCPKSGSGVGSPQQLIWPDSGLEGIVDNVAEMRLYYYPPGGNTVEVLPIGIGQAGRETPRNWVTAVERKQEGPTWSPTPNTRRAYAAEGKTLPAFVPAGPDNPMGLYAIYIGRLYAIHGTNSNFGIGLRVSQGCIRLRNADIKYLFDNVPVGTRVQIINEPVKYAIEPDGRRYVEVHRPLAAMEEDNPQILPIAQSAGFASFVAQSGSDKVLVNKALSRRAGIPVAVSVGAEPSANRAVQSVQNQRIPVASVEETNEQATQ